MTESIFLLIFLALAVYYFLFLLKIFFGLGKLQIKGDKDLINEFISIIVPFRNEEENIEEVYLSLVNQNYPKDKYEIIFINDSSTDNSKSILKKIANAPNICIYDAVDDDSSKAHKKRAVTFGIEQSRGEIIVTTDADCIHPNTWLRSLLKYLDSSTAFISGPVKFDNSENLFEKIQSLEFAGLVITGAGLIGANDPMICNAANIAYRKKVFEEVGGYSNQMEISSGDDEMLMQKIHRDTSYKISFALDKCAVVSTKANKTISEFYYQRKRWASKGLFYKNNFILLKLILIYFFYLSIFLLPILGVLISSKFIMIFFISILIKMFSEYLVLKRGINLLFEKDLLRPFLITEILQVPYLLVAGFTGVFGNYIWKDREIKR
jgi:cellulose synthase/poly-beta-1,6-N-acetylglucosamine synthase-like glycosyltransferase